MNFDCGRANLLMPWLPFILAAGWQALCLHTLGHRLNSHGANGLAIESFTTISQQKSVFYQYDYTKDKALPCIERWRGCLKRERIPKAGTRQYLVSGGWYILWALSRNFCMVVRFLYNDSIIHVAQSLPETQQCVPKSHYNGFPPVLLCSCWYNKKRRDSTNWAPRCK